MVKHDVVARKLVRARKRLGAADEIFTRPLEVYLADESARDLACFYLFLAIQECIDIAAHWVADADWGPPDDVGEVFDLLNDHRVIDRPLADKLRGATGLRNRIAHGYGSLDPERIRAEYLQGSAALQAFLAVAAEAVGL